MKCTACGRVASDDANFCVACGSALGDEPGEPHDTVRDVVHPPHTATRSSNDDSTNRAQDAENLNSDSSLRVSLASLDVKTPRQKVLMAVGVIFALVALIGGALVLTQPSTENDADSLASVNAPDQPQEQLDAADPPARDEPSSFDAGPVTNAGDTRPSEISSEEPPEPRSPRRPARKRTTPARPSAKRPSTTSKSSEPPPETTKTETPEVPLETVSQYARRMGGLVSLFHGPAAQRCFGRATGPVRPARGTVVLAFTINPDGTTRNPAIIRNTTNDDGVALCFLQQPRTWSLSPTPDGRPLRYQLTFSQ